MIVRITAFVTVKGNDQEGVTESLSLTWITGEDSAPVEVTELVRTYLNNLEACGMDVEGTVDIKVSGQ